MDVIKVSMLQRALLALASLAVLTALGFAAALRDDPSMDSGANPMKANLQQLERITNK